MQKKLRIFVDWLLAPCLACVPSVNSEPSTTRPRTSEIRSAAQEATQTQQSATDYDKDGVSDAEDRCPDLEGIKPRGCPLPLPDSDHEGLVDSEDKCPLEAETPNGFQDRDGCADQIPSDLADALKGSNYSLRDGDALEQGGGISERMAEVVDRVASALRKYPEVSVVVFVYGIDADRPQYGRNPTQRRADSLATHIKEQGKISIERVSAQGLGASSSRRIEFQLMVEDGFVNLGVTRTSSGAVRPRQ